MIDAVIGCTGHMEGVHIEDAELGMPFMDAAARFADLEGTVLLMSGGQLDAARYHILAVRPWLTFKARGRDLEITADEQQFSHRDDPLAAVQALLAAYALPGPGYPDPVAAGLFGYLSYDLKDFIEALPRTAVDDLGLPQACLYAPSVICIHDRRENRTRLFIPVLENSGEGGVEAIGRWFKDRLNAPEDSELPQFSGGAGGFVSPFTKNSYMAAVEKIRDYIVSGHIYQVNLSQRFETDFSGSPYAMFTALYDKAPASFYAYVNAGDHWIVSTSPERFLLQRGDRVETRPIKGTRPRGGDAEEDRALADALQRSPKDAAELSMIVDLMRNDLGRVCAGGSVKVVAHKRLEPYENVFHLVSVIQGRMLPGRDAVDLIRAAFPGGSITGCPRIRAMEIIDELEPCRRHIYTGSIGYIGFHGTMDLSIAIRTATITGGRMFFSVGGGVVFDSDPADEYEETLHKGRSVMSVFENRKAAPAAEARVWLNGMVMPASAARLPATDLGLQYGYGFFETIRVDQGRAHLLGAHISRFAETWRALFGQSAPDLTWTDVIGQVIAANHLGRRVCAVKLVAAFGGGHEGFSRPNLLVTATPYVHRLAAVQKPALDLAVYPYPRQTPLADHKTLNYLYYYMAGRWARSRGADEAVVTNPDGTLSESCTANLLLLFDRTVARPASPHVLPGVMEAAVIRLLKRRGFHVETRPLTVGALTEADAVLLTNSLMGPVGAHSIDETPLANDPSWVDTLRSAVFAEGY